MQYQNRLTSMFRAVVEELNILYNYCLLLPTKNYRRFKYHASTRILYFTFGCRYTLRYTYVYIIYDFGKKPVWPVNGKENILLFKLVFMYRAVKITCYKKKERKKKYNTKLKRVILAFFAVYRTPCTRSHGGTRDYQVKYAACEPWRSRR